VDSPLEEAELGEGEQPRIASSTIVSAAA